MNLKELCEKKGIKMLEEENVEDNRYGVELEDCYTLCGGRLRVCVTAEGESYEDAESELYTAYKNDTIYTKDGESFNLKELTVYED